MRAEGPVRREAAGSKELASITPGRVKEAVVRSLKSLQPNTAPWPPTFAGGWNKRYVDKV